MKSISKIEIFKIIIAFIIQSPFLLIVGMFLGFMAIIEWSSDKVDEVLKRE